MAMGAGFSGRSGLMLLGALALGLIGGGVWYAGRGPEPGGTLVPAAPGSQTGAQTPQTQPAAQVETPAPETPAEATPPANDPAEQAEAEPPAVPATPEDSAATEPAPEATAGATTETDTTAQADPAPETASVPEDAAAEPAPPPPLAVPTFDVVRVEPDGSALVAGSAAPLARLRLMLNGQEIGEARAGSDGKFAAFLTLEPDAEARVLTLLADLDGQEAASEDQIILAPVAPPLQLAEAETTPAPEPALEAAAPENKPAAPDAPQEAAADPAEAAEPDPAPQAVALAAEPEPTPADAADTPPPAPQTAEAEAAPEQRPEPAPETVQTAKVADPATDVAEAADPAPQDAAAQAEEVQTAEPKPEVVAQAAPAPEPEVAPQPEPEPEATEALSAPEEVAGTDPDPAQSSDTSNTSVPTGSQSAQPTVLAAVEAQTRDPSRAPPPTGEGSIAPPASAPAATPPEAPAAVAVLRATRDGIELLQPATPRRPEAMAQIALDAIGYSERGEVQLSGRAQGKSVVRVYLNNKPVADLNAADDGKWQGQITGIAPGIYTLRLDELGQGGRVLSRIETPFKREAPEVLRPPAPEGAPEHTPLIRAVTVQKGDTLWAISRSRYGDGLLYVRVFQANREAIRNPDLIYPGQVFALPD